MKRKWTVIPLLPLIAALMLLLSLPKGYSEKIRGTAVALVAPLWLKLLPLKASPPETSSAAKLQTENQLLKIEIQRTNKLNLELYKNQAAIQRSLNASSSAALHSSNIAERLEVQKLRLTATPADVIYRAASTWNSSLWINVGKATNVANGNIVIAENSPVILGEDLIGLVDYVGEKQSRIRLITDSGVVPAVRVLRSEGVDLRLFESIDRLQVALTRDDILSHNSDEKKEFLAFLQAIQKRLSAHPLAPLYLAKGELHGNGAALWKGSSHNLTGVGFNCDFADDKGPARDLRFGTPYGSKEGGIPLIKKGDLLVTSGLDGVFPPGLHVAEVTAIHPLQEGDYYYTLEAKPAADNLDELSLLFVIAPLGFDPEEQPSYYYNP